MNGRATAPGHGPLRVAFCIDNMNVGGTELNALRTARHLRDRGVQLRVISLGEDGPLLERYAELGIPVHRLPIGGLFGRQALRRGRELAGIIRRERIHILHAHDFYSNIFAGPWARMAGAAFLASRRWWQGPDRRGQRWANRASYVLAQRVLANSPAVAELLTRVEHVREAAVVVVPNYLDEPAFAPPPPGWTEAFAGELGLPQDRLVVGVVASLQPVKDHATLLRAIALLAHDWPQLHAVLVGGDAGSLGELRALAMTLGIAERVHFAGLRPSIPSPHYLFDISALTSVSEGLPNSILEAMAAGRPVVATAVGAVADAVVAGETGRLIPAGDVPGLAAALGAYLENPAERAHAGRLGALRARECYSADVAIERLLQVYHSLARPDRLARPGDPAR